MRMGKLVPGVLRQRYRRRRTDTFPTCFYNVFDRIGIGGSALMVAIDLTSMGPEVRAHPRIGPVNHLRGRAT